VTTTEPDPPAIETAPAARPQHAPATDGGSPRQERFHQLDGLRAVAVVLVVFCHAAAGPIGERLRDHGHAYLGDLVWFLSRSGVQLFFVLSGVALLRPYLRGRPFDARRYGVRRVERIYPPYWVALVVAGLVVAFTTAVPSWYSGSVLPTFSWTQWLSGIPIFNVSGVLYNSAWWSLEIELLFYLSVPLFVRPLASARFTRRIGVALLVATLGVSLVATQSVDRFPYAGWSSGAGLANIALTFAQYLPCFVGGILIARWDWRPRVGWAVLGAGAAWTAAALARPPLDVVAGFGILYTGLVIVSFGTGPAERRVSGPLSRWTVVWLGERSYSLFLIHFSVLYLVYHVAALAFTGRTGAYVVVTRAIGLPLALLAAMALFTLVERRFARNLVTADRFWPWRGSRRTAPTS
jgi:peptidoglycan/LPS O-acetylase OafA/YrhL